MATKSENAVNALRQARPKRPKAVTKPKRHPKHTGWADRKKHSETNSLHNLQGKQRDDVYEYEVSAGRPSRKSTRISKNHTKAGVGFKNRQTMRMTSPQSRAGRGS
jgi:hypothetical protein